MAGRRALDWVLIAAVTAIWAALFARGVGEGLRTAHGWVAVAVSSAADSDSYPVVLSTGKDLEQGDRIEAVEGEDLRGAFAVLFYDRVTRAARDHQLASLRASRNGASFETRLGLSPMPWWWAHALGAPLTFGIGLLLLLRVPGWHLARRNFVLLACVSALNASLDWKSGPIRGTWLETNLGVCTLAFAVGLGIWSAQDFTRSARPVPGLLRALAIAAAIGTAVIHLIVRGYLPHSWTMYRIPAIALTLFSAATVVLSFTRAYLRSDGLERRQIRWAILGFSLAYSGTTVAAVTSYTDARTFGRLFAALTSPALPAGILVSVIGYRWLDIDRLISAAMSYAILGAAVLGAALAVLPGASRVTAPLLGVGPSSMQWLLTMVLVLGAIPAHSWLWPRVDRSLFRERHQRMLGFARLLDEIGSYASVADLVRLTGERVDALLAPESIAVHARAEGCFACVFARGAPMPPPSLDADSLLVRALEQRGKPLWVDASELDAFDRAALETLGVELIVPIRGRNELTAIVCLGRKRSGDIYTPQEVAHLGAVASRCTEVLLRLTPQPAAETSRRVFRREGDLWTIESAGKQIRLRDMRGLHYLATLLREPGREFAAIDLVNLASGIALGGSSSEDPTLRVVSGLGDAGERLDARARAAYRARLAEIEEERAEAERHGDLGRLGRASEEREALLAELVAAARGRRAASHAERARVAVTKAIGSALERIAERHPELGAHLSAQIRRGYLCSYVQQPRDASEWET